MSYEFLQISAEGPVTTIQLNRPKVNALSLPLIQELARAVKEAEQDDSVRVIVLTGTGRFFAAGADIPTLQQTRENPLQQGGLLSEGIKTMQNIEKSHKPIIAAVNGIALGGGCELCLACHIRLAAESATFGQPEINLGIIPGWGGTHRLPLLIGESRAREWLLTGRTVSAKEAYEAGLVARIFADAELLPGALEYAKALAEKPPLAVAHTLSILNTRMYYPERGAELEAAAFTAIARSEDAAEGIAAFLEKRKPVFKGR
jgi:enoyl-CoA hydratase